MTSILSYQSQSKDFLYNLIKSDLESRGYQIVEYNIREKISFRFIIKDKLALNIRLGMERIFLNIFSVEVARISSISREIHDTDEIDEAFNELRSLDIANDMQKLYLKIRNDKLDKLGFF